MNKLEKVRVFCWSIIMLNMVVGMYQKYGPGYEDFHWSMVGGRMVFALLCATTIFGIHIYRRRTGGV